MVSFVTGNSPPFLPIKVKQSLSVLMACHGMASLCLCEEKAAVASLSESRVASVETGGSETRLLGDCGGLRSKLIERGVHVRLGYIGEVFGNVSGGRRTGAVYGGLAEMSMELDLERLASGGWHDGRFYTSALWTHGASLSTRLVGDAHGASNIEAYDGVRLYKLWMEQSFFDERLSLRLGNLLADSEFASTDYSGELLNSAFGWPAFISANVINGGPAFPVAAPGLRVRWSPQESWFMQAGAYDGDSFDSPSGDPRVNADGLHWRMNGQQGAFAMGEIGFLRNHGKDDTGLPGSLRIGAWEHTADFADNYRDTAGGSFIVSGLPAKMHRGTFGAYVAAEQMLWREGESLDEREQGLGLFGRFGAGPRDRSAFEWVASGGIHYRGPLPGRDNDRLVLGFVFAQVSRDIRRQQRDDRDANGSSYAAFADHESVLELSYHYQLTPWMVVNPDFQWIHHPGGSGATPDAFLVGLRFNITF